MKNLIKVISLFLLLASMSLSADTNIRLDPIVNNTEDRLIFAALNKMVAIEPGGEASLSDASIIQIYLDTSSSRVIEDGDGIVVGVQAEEDERAVEGFVKMEDLLDNAQFEVVLGDYLLVFKQVDINVGPFLEVGVPGVVAGVGAPTTLHFELEIKSNVNKYVEIMDSVYDKIKDKVESIM